MPKKRKPAFTERRWQSIWQSLCDQIKDALEGDSNDAEHDALVAVAYHFGIAWTEPGEDDED